jgi:dTDP-4-amino-4,6-dideoxygalactose transaminase
MEQISAVNLSTCKIDYEDQLFDAISQVLKSGIFILGQWVEQFESSFAHYHKIEHAVGVGSGTDALILALKALEIKPGDEIITVPNSFISTAAAIVHVGAKVVFVDVNDQQNMDPRCLEAAINKKTRAIIPVHLNGKPAPMTEIMQIANTRELPVIEDCSQAIGASYRGQPVGTFGKMGCFSLHPLKNLGAFGDAGIVITSDKKLADKIKPLRNHGLIDRDTCSEWGYNSRLDALQAAILAVKLKHIDEVIKKKRQLAQAYFEELQDVPILLPVEKEGEICAWYTFVIRTESRDELQKFLKNNGVEALVHYPVPIHLQPAAKELHYQAGSFPVCESQARRILSLPIRPDLGNKDIRQISGLVRRFFEIKSSTSTPM